MRLKHYLLYLLLILGANSQIAQTMVPFAPRLTGGNVRLKGDVVYVGNSILGRTTTNPQFNSSGQVTNLATLTAEANTANVSPTGNNNGVNFEYIDIDGDNSTFSSSSADLNINTGVTNCKRIIFAGLYWTAVYPYDRTRTSANYEEETTTETPRFNDFNQVRLRLPNGTFINAVADNAADPVGQEDSIIFDGYNYYPGGNPEINGTKSFKDAPYVCYKNITSELQALADANGTYTLANMRAARGARGNGSCGGWTIVIVYESPNLPSKYISVFDGFSGIDATRPPVDFAVNGFQTVPNPLPVRANIGAVTLEGDRSLVGDSFRFKSNSIATFTEVSNGLNPGDNPATAGTNESNFFNSTITNNNVSVLNRNPASTNTLGFDMDIVAVNNPGNTVIPNGETGATLRVTTTGDSYSTHIVTFAVEIIEPKIVLTKTIEDVAGNPIADGASLNLGQTVNYVINFENIGNDDATNCTIRDVLPVNTIFDFSNLTAPNLILPAGVTIQSVNAATREIVFRIADARVLQNIKNNPIKIRVRVVSNCYELVDACENRIRNQAFATYSGVINPSYTITDDPSLSTFSACLLGTPSPTNFIGNIDDCAFEQNVILCGNTIRLDAPGGYAAYTWTGPAGATITPVAGTNNQSVIVNQVGTYNVFCNAPDPCVDVPVTFNVTTFGATLANPVITYLQGQSDPNLNYDIKTCPDNGLQLPYIYLCGTNDSVTITTNIAGATSIVWEKLDESSCTAVINQNCPNQSTSCSWINPVNNPNFTVNTAGQYRVTVNFPGGCNRIFYFNVSQETLDFTVNARDIICLTPGNIAVIGVPPTGYEFSLSSPTGTFTNVWQTSNVFANINTPGVYTVYIRKLNFPGGCVFEQTNIGIRLRNFSVTPTYQEPLCFGDRGSITLGVLDAAPNYYFSLYLGATATGTPIDSSGPVSVNNNFTFSNLTPGQQYTWLVTTDDGCRAEGTHTFQNPLQFGAIASLTRSLTSCSSGEITITTINGVGPFNYYINNYPAGPFQSSNVLTVDQPGGNYNITVVDANNCIATTSIVVTPIAPPSNIVVTPTNITCNPGANNGTITVTANANGNSLQYSINGGTPQTSNIFTGLSAGAYTVTVHYTAGTGANAVTCTAVQAPVNITAPTQISVSANINPRLTCTQPGIINVVASGGTGTLEYSINGTTFQSSNQFTITASGTYTITVRDANGCTNTTTVVAPSIQGPTDLILVGQVRPTSCSSTGSLNVNISGIGGQSPIRYSIVAPAAYAAGPQSSGNFANLPAGTYTFEVSDNNGCTYREDFTLVALPAPTITAQVLNNVRCFGESNGNGVFTITGLPNNVRYNYVVINTGTGTTIASTTGNPRTPASGSTTLTVPISNQPAGTYQITFTSQDYDNCTYTQTLTIQGPAQALAAPYTTVNPTCTANGSITVNPIGGWGGYTYTISPNAGVVVSGNVFANLLPNTAYTITVTDTNGCPFVINHTFNAPPPVNATISGDFCYDGTNAASLIVTTTSGTAPFEYSINNGVSYQTSNTFPNLTPGTYTIIVRDANGCTRTFANNVIAPQLTITAALQKDLTCSAPTSAVITGTVTGGISPTVTINYTGSGSPSPFTGFPYSTNAAGTYTFTATYSTPSGNCSVTSNVITVTTPVNPTATHTQTNILCNGGNNGSVTITPSSGTAPYLISFNGSGFTSTTTYNSLTAGTYPYIVQDAKGCTFNGTVIITQPTNALSETHNTPVLSCNPTTNAFQSATLTVNGQNGTGPYQYSFNGGTFTATNTFVVNDNGTNQTINFVVQDANGCTVPGSVTVNRLNPPAIASVTTTTITCNATTSTATVNLTAGTGVGTLNYVLSGTASASNTTGIFPGLLAGPYSVTVTDANGCFATRAFTIAPVTPISVTGTKISDVLCNGGNTGAAQFTVSGFGSTYSYSVNGGTVFTGQTATTINLPNLIANSYIINITDEATGCTATATVTITQPATALSLMASTTNVNCNNDISQISITASGGTPNYTYAAVISGSPAPALGTYTTTNPLSVDTNSGANLVWDVYVRDANGCIEMTTVTIILDGVPSVTVPPLASNQCTASTGFTFTATGSGGVPPYTYSINGVAGPFQANPTFTVNTPGTYTVTIKDANGCTASSSTTTVVSPQLTASIVLTKDLTCSAPTDGTIQLNVNGGLAPYQYQLQLGGLPVGGFVAFAGTSTTISVNAVGNYTVIVRDTNGCTVTTNQVTTTAAVPPTVIANGVDPTCNAGADGSVSLIASGGTSPYQYSFNGSPFGNTNVFGGLTAGTYNYIVRDFRGCTTPGSIILNNPAPIVVNIVKTGIVCNVNTLGSFDVTIVSGGSPNYVYTLYDGSFNVLATSGSTPATNFNFPNLNFGDYYIKVTDSKGCEFLSVRQRIETQPFLTFTAQVDSNNCATGVDVTVTTSGGVAPYDYSIFGQPDLVTDTFSTTFTYTGLSHNTTYFFQVRDANGCISILEFTTPPAPSTINITGVTTTNVTCNGSGNGSISFTVQAYDATVTNINYVLLNALTNLPVVPAVNGTLTGPAGGPVSGVINSLPPGNYNLQVQEASGTLCPANYNFTISQPPTPLSANITGEINANCNNGAQITVTATGGTAPYQYAFVADGVAPLPADYTSSNVGILNPPTLNWDIWVQDANGCTFKIDKVITVDPLPTINAIAQQCFVGSPLTFTVSGTSFNGNLVYGINSTNTVPTSFQASNAFIVSSAGTYYFFVKDDNGCTASTSVIVAPQLQLQATLTQDLTCAVDASINLVASSGTPPYVSYGVSTTGSTGPFTPTATPYVTNVAGSYYFQVTDTQGCTAVSNEVIVTPRTSPTFNYTQTNVSCNGGANGSINITASNGIAPYEYSIDGGTTWFSTNLFTGLTNAGVYNVVVRDAKLCLSPATLVDITEPSLVSGNIILTQGLTCGAGNVPQAAIVTVTGSGGTAPYTYSFDGGLNYTTTNTYSTTVAGTVTAYVKDANGCIIAAPLSIPVPALNPPTDMDFSSTAVTCIATTSTVTINSVTNGVAPFTYEIISPIVVAPQASNSFAGLSPSIPYLFQVTDTNGCTYQEYYTIAPVTNIEVTGQLLADVSCNGGNDGSVQFTVSNFTGTYSYSVNAGPINTGQTGAVITLNALVANTYTINVTDEITGCTATALVVVSEPSVIGIVLDSNINANCIDQAEVTVHGTGGTPTYTYAVVAGGSPAPAPAAYTNTNGVFYLNPGNWDVYVRDLNNCIAFITVTTTLDPLPIVTLPGVTPDQCTSNGTSYTFTAVGSSGVAPYTFSIDGVSFQSSGTFTVTSSGTYTVTIKDANECTSTASITIYPPVSFNLDVTADADCTPPNSGEITVSATGGSGNYTYQTIAPSPIVTGPQASNVFANLTPGTYTIQVNDTFLNPATSLNETCSKTATIEVEAPEAINFTLNATDVTCNLGSDGTITVIPVTGNQPITYTITSGPASLTYPIASVGNTFSNLPAGTYNVNGTNARNCNFDASITIDQPTPVLANATATQFGCNADNSPRSVQITVSGSGGTPGYLYSIDGTNYGSDPIFYIPDNGLPQNFTAYVKDVNGCVDDFILPTIQPLSPLTAQVDVNTIVPITCTNPEQITIVASGGTGVYTYQYVGPTPPPAIPVVTQGVSPNDNQFTITQPGTYTFQVTDANGCYTTVTHEILPYNTIQATLSLVNDVTCFGGTNGQMSLRILTFAEADPTSTNNTLTYVGDYQYTVYDSTTNTPVSAALTNVAANTSSNPVTISGLPFGSYYVVINELDAPFCNFTTGAQSIGTPQEVILTLQQSADVTCSNDQGAIAITVQGGTGTYTVQQVLNTTTGFNYGAQTTGLAAGSYSVTVVDSNGCPDTATIDLVQPSQIQADPIPTVNLLCNGDSNGSVTVQNVTGGQNIPGNYTYTLNYLSNTSVPSSGPQTSPTFSNLGQGSYSITINDGYNNCDNTFNFTVNEPTKVTASLRELAGTQDCETSAQSLELSASGGVEPYTYDVSPNGTFGSASFTSATPAVITNVAPGAHTYYVKDANGCISVATNEVTINPLEDLQLQIISLKDELNCFSDSDGSLEVEATGGLGNYQYSLVNITTSVTYPTNTTGLFTGLPQGQYVVTVNSSNGNAALACNPEQLSFEINGPTVPFVVTYDPQPAKCFGENTGSIVLTISGGQAPFQYILTPVNDPQQALPVPANLTIENLFAGSYELTVLDANGCSGLFREVITIGGPFAPVSFSISNYDDETCLGDNDGRIELSNISGGTTSATTWYSVAIFPQNNIPNPIVYTPIAQGVTTFDSGNVLAPGIYFIEVIDANNCPQRDVFEIKAGDNIDPVLEPFIDCENDVSVSKIRVVNNANTNGTFPVGTTFELLTISGVVTNPVFSSVDYPQIAAGGTFTVEVISPSLCLKTATTTTAIAPLQQLNVTLTQTNLNTVTATAIGGSGNYEYTFYGDGGIVQSGSNNVFIYYQQYNEIRVVVTDNSGCVDEDFGNYPYIPICIPDVMTPDGNGQNDDWGPGCVDPTVYPKLITRVYDRYGRLIATLPVGARWNGKYEGKDLPSGDYWYVLKVDKNDGQEFVGHFTLYR